MSMSMSMIKDKTPTPLQSLLMSETYCSMDKVVGHSYQVFSEGTAGGNLDVLKIVLRGSHSTVLGPARTRTKLLSSLKLIVDM